MVYFLSLLMLIVLFGALVVGGAGFGAAALAVLTATLTAIVLEGHSG